MTAPHKILGTPRDRQVLVVADHAANAVPEGVELGIAANLMNDHIAIDIGTAEIASHMAQTAGHFAYLARYSRLVVDLNRDRSDDGVIPQSSDSIAIPGNALDTKQREYRLKNYFDPYHDKLASLIAELKPALIISLHSFTPVLRSKPGEERPWDMGILYNEQSAASKLALQSLQQESLNIGDQKPYSGKLLNATMNRHSEATGTAYFGVEIRQDHITDSKGQTKFAEILSRTANDVLSGLA